jgi:DNA-binding MarR family transcriptional regulator
MNDMPPVVSTVDIAALASQVRLGVTRLARKLRREGDPGVTPTLLAALSTIERHGPMTAGSLASHEQVEKPTVTRLLAALDERELIDRTPDPLDRRVAWLQVSPSGRKLLQRTRRRKDEYLAKRIRDLSPEDQATLEVAAEILDRLTEGDR